MSPQPLPHADAVHMEKALYTARGGPLYIQYICRAMGGGGFIPMGIYYIRIQL